MADGSILTDAIKAFIGRTSKPEILKLEDGSIQRFAEAVGTSNPIYTDVSYAKKSKHGRLLAPPSFKGWPIKSSLVMETGILGEMLAAGAPGNLLDGGVIYEYFDTIKSGDILFGVSKVESIVEKQGKSGKMLVMTTKGTFTNQDGKVVLTESRDMIMR